MAWLDAEWHVSLDAHQTEGNKTRVSSHHFIPFPSVAAVANAHHNQRTISTRSKANQRSKLSSPTLWSQLPLQLHEPWPTTIAAPRNSSTATASSTSPASTTLSEPSISPPAASPMPSSQSWDLRVAVRSFLLRSSTLADSDCLIYFPRTCAVILLCLLSLDRLIEVCFSSLSMLWSCVF